MSVKVDLDQLADALEDFDAGYLLIVSPEGRVKVVSVQARLDDGRLVAATPGKGTAANIAVNSCVTVLFAPREFQGMSLIVDGRAELNDSDVSIVPEVAVLHRPAAHSPAPSAPGDCANDCQPLGEH